MMKKSLLLLVLTSLLLITQMTVAAEKKAECEITSNNKVVFKGKCLFFPEHGGTFSLSALDNNKPLFDDILIVSVAMTQKNVAEVRGLTTSGINSRWGEAKRSVKDKACWKGSDFIICAR